MKQPLARFGIDGFLIAILAMVLLAFFFPGPGIAQKPISLEEIAGYGVSVIFLFYGLRLSPEKMKAGLSNWKMHLLIQGATFLLFPLLILALKPLFIDEQGHLIWLGCFFLAALPSTVSSSVVMVSIARGNMPAAIFNASISSLLGIVITPVWTGLFIAPATGQAATSSIVVKLCLQVLLPVIAGILLHRYFGEFAETHKKKLKYFDQSIILLIIYTSFSHSFADHLFDGFSITTIVLLAIGLLLLFLVIAALLSMLSRWLGFDKADRTTVIFCGSKKSLVHGTVLSKILFPDSTIAGIILLPLMLYHSIQLIAASIMAQQWANTATQKKNDRD